MSNLLITFENKKKIKTEIIAKQRAMVRGARKKEKERVRERGKH